MTNKTKSIITTTATALLCGCPGLLMFCWGVLATSVGLIPGGEVDMGRFAEPGTPAFGAIVSLCTGTLLLTLTIAVGFALLRKKPAPGAFDESLPPAS